MELVDAPHSKCGTFGFVGSSPTAPTYLMGTYQRLPIRIRKGNGCWVWDEFGNKYLDAVAGIATCSLGHSHKRLKRVLTKQLSKIQHISNLYEIPEQEELAKWITKNSCFSSVFFCNSGAEANEAAIKLARKYGQQHRGINRPIILSAKESFHGRTLAALSATGQEKYHKGFEPLVDGFDFFEFNNINSFRYKFKELERNAPKVAAVLIEPLQGEGGVNLPDQSFFKELRHICSKNEVLLIFDEVQTGMGRTGTLWGYEQTNIEPDAFTLAKGLGGGHAIGALAIKDHADVFIPGDHASTFGGNPFACKAGITVGEEIIRKNLLKNVINQGSYLNQGLTDIVNLFPNEFKEVRGIGLIQGLVIKESSDLIALDIVKAALKEKLLLVAAGSKVVRMVPPLIINRNEIKEIIKRLTISIKSIY